MSTKRDSALCYVIMSGPDAAGGACVIDGTPKKDLANFLREGVGKEIRTVTVIEARRLLGNHFASKPKPSADCAQAYMLAEQQK